MKKFFSTIWSVLRYILIYFGFSIVVYIPVVVYYSIKYFNEREEKIVEEMAKVVIPITAFISLLSLAVFLIVIKYCHRSIKDFLEIRKISLRNSLHVILIAIVTSFFSVSLTNILSVFFTSYEYINETIANSLTSGWNLLLMTILLPIFEEIFFRGIIFNELKKRINLKTAIIIQAILFGLFHGNILQGIYTTILAIALALAYHWTHSIFAPIIIHIVYNLLGTLIIPVILYYTEFLTIPYLIVSVILMVFLLRRMRKRLSNNEIYQVNSSVDNATVFKENNYNF
ncbi:MAG: CPBP family intramembrane metalloprotease [Clostridiales bacterium]|uniref:CPBP family intramembrane glutamic endopeptidase n=1 Tax=Clostridium sp. N3C TaxID=1776758 RepID=UPI00092E00B8|nr:type II CAAX endopeptidase family protein [Clostridium sp. N3C]NLZ47976.1 CPBP family intramembrane metalloprotease [Clostridiales bacterium]SCN24448.1 CAAX prenyl protease-related protein [Clostridium sp. N3C]